MHHKSADRVGHPSHLKPVCKKELSPKGSTKLIVRDGVAGKRADVVVYPCGGVVFGGAQCGE